ncbi:hypothetical protein TD95_004560 [Thielaviopsis punctulata]|uniref:Importin N-terminal domain-containing protein n=1 Tax=Thielaviopsis punctulata TaxID=72032 RepID=A0A0F4ZIQ4_9PEZI|nr:hypothetical protein TD95_004560 [Thielaviopsis punctulata]
MSSTPIPSDVFQVEDVLAAVVAMRSNDLEAKKKAQEFLQSFQKSTGSWATIISILQSSANDEAKLFAAITLRGKVTYDLSTQIPEAQMTGLRDQLLVFLTHFASGPKAIRVQLCVSLAILAIQMKEWKDVLPTVVNALNSSHAAILDFLRVLPEEVTEGRKITLTEEELSQRTTELLGNNSEQVVQLLTNYAQSSPEAAQNPQLMECITAWLKEVPVSRVASSPLLELVFAAIQKETSTTEAAECLCAILRETCEVDDNRDVIMVLFPKLIQLRPLIKKFVDEDDIESYKAITKVFSTAAEAWVVAIAREPQVFGPLVEAVMDCATLDKDRDVIEHTFHFWYELKQYLVLEIYMQGRLHLAPVYSKLVDVLLKHLEYPASETSNELDLFDGDREQEEKFREFRHQMGDTLKDCCEVLGVTECLTKVLDVINQWMQKHAATATATSVPHWQELEAPLFAMRAMGRMVDHSENIVLPQLIPLLVQIPSHEKLRFATIMVLGRYTEWTAAHPEFLESQFTYIVSSFETDSKEIIRAAAMAIKFFCTDCRDLLSGQVEQLQKFYDQILDKLPIVSQEEMTEGVASVVAVQPVSEIHRLLSLYCDPLFQRLATKANAATTDEGKLALADHLNLIVFFVQIVVPNVENGQENPAVKYWQERFDILSTILRSFIRCIPICERICKCWRNMVISYRTAMTPLLPQMANELAEAFTTSREGCFLWASAAILREFSEDREHVSPGISDSIYAFFEMQATSFLRVMAELQPRDLPDVVEDFFRLLVDALLYYPQRLIPSALLTPIFEAAIYALTLEQRDPLSSTLHFLLDLISYASNNPANSNGLAPEVSAQLQSIVRQLLLTGGAQLVKQVMAGMMITFPRDCFANGSSVLLDLFRIFPQETAAWVESTIGLLPAGTVTPTEATRLLVKIKERLQSSDAGDRRQVRTILQDFTNSYRRRNVAPRDGLGQLEATRFRFVG